MLFGKELLMFLVVTVKSTFISVELLPPVCEYNLDFKEEQNLIFYNCIYILDKINQRKTKKKNKVLSPK